jgi:hypothetical protein
VTETAKIDLLAAYLEIALADGARADDPRLALLCDLMSDDEIKRAKEAIGTEWLRRETLARPN